jgi:glucose/mannose-6-phosphate isomerase
MPTGASPGTPLDDASLQHTCDPSGMLDAALALSRQIRDAWEIGRAAQVPPLPRPPAHIIVAGMGGSAIGGELLAAALGPRLTVPFVVARDASLPPYAGPGSVVIATSYSGETEETLAAAAEARRLGATVLAITSGGRLPDLAGATVRVPGGLAPRAALGYLMMPALAALERWRVVTPCGGEVEEAADILGEIGAECAPPVPTAQNPAKRLASALAGRIPAVYAASPVVEPAARRWKCQFNENSKTFSTWNMFPELTHNEVVGWGAPPEVRGILSAIILIEGAEPERVLRRIRITTEVALRRAAGVHEVCGRGTSRFSKLLSLVLLGDLVSIYLAYLRGVDPAPVEAIDSIKRQMREA